MDIHLADKKEMKEMEDILDYFYGLTDQEQLDKNNKPLNFLKRASELKKQNEKQSMSTMDACNHVVIKALMSREVEFVRNKFN